MKHLIKLFAITLLLSLVACSESDQENSDQVSKKETDVISIDGTKHSFTFTEDKQGNITLDKGQEGKEKTITDYFKTNLTASSYYDESDKILYLFKDSETMVNFINKNTKIKTLKATSTNKTASITGASLITLSLYDNPDFDPNTLLHKVEINVPFPYYTIREPNLSILRIGDSAYINNIEDKISSINLSVGPQGFSPQGFQQVTAIFYEERNYGGYSFGMSLNSYNSQTSHNNLATLRMYKSWINGSKYYDNRISSFKMSVNNSI
ncbi:hypothetical protein C8C85_2787 [Flavobacterium sp. 103]|uniref:hypothetical protein n=1 Tax=Flavobacterium sp. 103 TaxID=2135624 RepID=UPI000D5E2F5A|nr:hypothetical protein [Flavobacterium sp. 103]PVX46893.1 hypothetical protein C8C85_2787 [Flavobacterium sp. 103]